MRKVVIIRQELLKSASKHVSSQEYKKMYAFNSRENNESCWRLGSALISEI